MNEPERQVVHRRVSRETRHLLLAALVAIVALWVLARLRFPDRPATPNPIPPLLTQLTSRPAFADLESELARARTRLSGVLVVVQEATATGGSSGTPRTALRVRPEAAVGFAPRVSSAREAGAELIAADRATGLVAVRVPPGAAAALPAPWVPESLDAPRFFAVTLASGDRVSLRPLFVPGLRPFRTPAWSGPVWLTTAPDTLEGEMVFTPAGELVGALARTGRGLAIVPGETLLADAQRLIDRGRVAPGAIGIEAQPLTPQLASAVGATAGVIVAHVDPDSDAAEFVRTGDVIVAVNGIPLDSWEAWDVRSNRFAANEPVVLHVRRDGTPVRIELVARTRTRPAISRALGLALRPVAGTGAAVESVEPGSAADRAGVRPGDVITMIAGLAQPTPADVREAFASMKDSQSLLVGITRGSSHHVLAMVK